MAPLWVVAVMALMAAGCGEESTVGDEGAGDGTTGSGTTGDGTTGEEPADDDAPIGGPYPVADLTIVVTHPEAGDVRYRVVCLGDTATLSGDEVAVDEQAACRALAEPAAVDRLVEGPPADRACTEQFGGHDVATITGTIDEVQVDATVDRTDGCGIDDWDTVLAGLLPPPADVSGS